LTSGLTLGTPSDKLGLNLLTESVTHGYGEVNLGLIFDILGNFFQNLFPSAGGGIDAGPPDNNPNRIIVVGTPLPTGSGFAGDRLGGSHFGGGPYQSGWLRGASWLWRYRPIPLG
jgi:hypothetical protein